MNSIATSIDSFDKVGHVDGDSVVLKTQQDTAIEPLRSERYITKYPAALDAVVEGFKHKGVNLSDVLDVLTRVG